jgi:5-methylcytosine-specific restriction protein A
MPYVAPSPCRWPGCPELVHGTYCAAHRTPRIYDQKRPSSTARGYGPRWRACRAQYIKEHPLCVNFIRCSGLTTVVDHIKPVSQGGDFWDPKNHQPMCEPCHNSKTAREDMGFGNTPRSCMTARQQNHGMAIEYARPAKT